MWLRSAFLQLAHILKNNVTQHKSDLSCIASGVLYIYIHYSNTKDTQREALGLNPLPANVKNTVSSE
jgi:hypothetical protein